jgi:hypothetical protein
MNYERSTYSPDAVEECLLESFSATAALATSSASLTDAEHYPSASKTAFSTMHPSIVGLSESLLIQVTLPFIRAWLTCSTPASPARRSALPESASQTKTLETHGQKPETQSESSDRDSASSKTCQGSSRRLISKRYEKIFADLDIECVQPCLVPRMSARHTLESGSGYLPTPTTWDAKNTHGQAQFDRNTPPLSAWVQKPQYQSPMPSDVHGGRTTKGSKRPNEGGLRKQLFPTPQAYSHGEGTSAPGITKLDCVVRKELNKHLFPTPRAEDGQSCGAHKGQPDTLTSFTKLFPTPQCRDAQTVDKCKRGANSPGGTPLPVAVGVTLNPDWVEWLMGWPIGWTDLKPLGMDKYRSWQQAHSRFSAKD